MSRRAIEASRLPDLPDAGYATRRQKETSDAIMFWLRGVERNRPLLLSIVIDGVDKWHKVAGSVWRGLLIDREILDSVFSFMVRLAGENPAQQLLILHGMQQEAARTAWDKRKVTRDALRKARNLDMSDLMREQSKPRKLYN